MKTALHLLTPALLFTSIAAAAETPVPAPHPPERYAPLARRSPFAVASAAPAPAAQASFAANWYVSGIARIGDQDFVSIKARDLAVQFSLFGHEPNPENGVALASIQWSETVGKSTIVLRKGTETARLEFNEAELRQTPAASTAGLKPPPTAGTSAPGSGPVAQANPPGTSAVRRRILQIQAPR